MSLTDIEACGAWSVADELLLNFEIGRRDPLLAEDFMGLAVKVTAGAGPEDEIRASAIALGVAAMRIALGERLVTDGAGKGVTC